MAYNNYFPATYQPYYQYQQQPVMQQAAQQQQQAPTIVQSGFVRVQNENEARMYPVAPGNSVTFIDENAPYCYTKSVDISQLDRPKFDKYRLVKEEDAPKQAETKVEYALKSDLAAFEKRLAKLEEEAKNNDD